MPVALFVAVTVTPGINAPEASAAVPPKVAFVVCANAHADNTTPISTPPTMLSFIVISPRFCGGTLDQVVQGCQTDIPANETFIDPKLLTVLNCSQITEAA
jgi:hypothetical protein